MRYVLVLLSLVFQSVMGQDESQKQYDIFRNKDGDKEWVVRSLVKDHGAILSSPFRTKKKDFKYVLPILSFTGLSMIFDEQIYSGFKSVSSQ